MDLFAHAETRARIAAVRDLLEHPRHSIEPKGRRYLERELRLEEAALRTGQARRERPPSE